MATQDDLVSLNRNIFEIDIIFDKIISYIDDETLPTVRLVSKKLFSRTLKPFRKRKWYNLQTFGTCKKLELKPIDHPTMMELWNSEFLNFKKFPIENFKIQWGIQSEAFRLGDFGSDFYDCVLWMFKNIGPNLQSVHMETNVLKWDHFQRNCEIPLCSKVQNVQLSMYNPKTRHESLVPLFLIKFESMKSFKLKIPVVDSFNNIIDVKDVYDCLHYNMEDWFALNELCISGNVPTKIFFEKMKYPPFSQIKKFKITPINGAIDLTSFQEFLNSNGSKIQALVLKIDASVFNEIEWPIMKALQELDVTEVGEYDSIASDASSFERGVFKTFPKLSKLTLSVQVRTECVQNVNYLRRTLLKFLPDDCNFKMENILQFHFSGFGERGSDILKIYKQLSIRAANIYPNVKNYFFNGIRHGTASDEDYYKYLQPGGSSI